MPSAIVPNRRAASPDGNDRPDYDEAVDDFMRDLEFDNQANNTNTAPQETPKDIDEEVQVKKKRKPNPKLDEARLLSSNGIPKLRRLTKSKLKFRGKGHEYTDITTLLNTYQLWLDDLYPKAKFKDGLAMVEKVGHSKRMQITRKAWLDSTKPHQREDSPERIGDVRMSGGLDDADGGEGASAGADETHDEIFGNSAPQAQSRQQNSNGGHENAPEDDELDALLNGDAATGTATSAAARSLARAPFEEDSDAEGDEFDALLAEEEAVGGANEPTKQLSGTGRAASTRDNENDDFADDEEAMASMGW